MKIRIAILLVTLIVALSLTVAACNLITEDAPPIDKNTDDTGNSDYDGNETDEKDKAYTVFFETGTEQTYEKISVFFGKNYTLPTPVRAGYGFLGWYNGKTAVENSGTWTIQSDTTLTAKWEMQTPGIIYESTADNSGYTVKGYSGDADKVFIASSYQGKPVVAIGEFAFYNCRTVSNVTIQGDVKSIGKYAFYGCSGMTDITLSDSVEAIGDYAFQNCTGLHTIVIPDRTTAIGTGAFRGCLNLYSITVSGAVSDIGENAFLGCLKLVEVINLSPLDLYPGNPDHGYVAYYAKKVVSDLGQNNLILEGDYVFYRFDDRYYLIAYHGDSTDVTLPEKINGSSYTVNQGAFYDTAVVSATISVGVEDLEANAFADCDKLLSVEFATNGVLDRIGKSTFSGCTNLTNITIPAGVTKIDDNAFYGCTALTKVVFAENGSLIRIGNNAFENCVSLSELALPDTLSNIGVSAFGGCSALQNISIPESVGIIAAGLFENCINLMTVEIPAGVNAIGNSAFEGCKKLTELTLPSGITVISDSTFKGCSALSEISLPEGINTIGKYAFDSSALEQIFIPDSVISIDDYAFNKCKKLNRVVFGDHIRLKEISVKTFGDCYALESVVIPDTVTTLQRGAFSNSGLTAIFIPASVEVVAESAFNNCRSLHKVTIAQNSRLQNVEKDAFNNCIALTEINIPATLTTIGSNAFQFCNMLNKVYFEGDYYDWNQITLSPTGNHSLTAAARYYYYAEKPETGGGWYYDQNGLPTLW